jgi:hypothetical protein
VPALLQRAAELLEERHSAALEIRSESIATKSLSQRPMRLWRRRHGCVRTSLLFLCAFMANDRLSSASPGASDEEEIVSPVRRQGFLLR